MARAHSERWVCTLRRECLDRLLVVGRRQLEQVLRADADHYTQRPHRELGQRPPLATSPQVGRLRRRAQLGGLLHEYELAA